MRYINLRLTYLLTATVTVVIISIFLYANSTRKGSIVLSQVQYL